MTSITYNIEKSVSNWSARNKLLFFTFLWSTNYKLNKQILEVAANRLKLIFSKRIFLKNYLINISKFYSTNIFCFLTYSAKVIFLKWYVILSRKSKSTSFCSLFFFSTFIVIILSLILPLVKLHWIARVEPPYDEGFI